MTLQPGTPEALSGEARESAHRQIHWQPSVFTLDEKVVGTDPAVFDLGGRARYLVSGPYHELAPGRWTATARFSVDDLASKLRFRAEWGGRETFSSFAFSPGIAGHYELAMGWRWDDPAEAEFRLVLTESAIFGTLAFAGVVLRLEPENSVADLRPLL